MIKANVIKHKTTKKKANGLFFFNEMQLHYFFSSYLPLKTCLETTIYMWRAHNVSVYFAPKSTPVTLAQAIITSPPWVLNSPARLWPPGLRKTEHGLVGPVQTPA